MPGPHNAFSSRGVHTGNRWVVKRLWVKRRIGRNGDELLPHSSTATIT